MKRVFEIMTAVMLTACAGNTAFVPDSVSDADLTQVSRVEPLSWWVGMKTPLQLLVQGDGISGYNVTIEGGKGVKVNAIQKADSPNYLFVDVNILRDAEPGTYYLVFSKDGKPVFKYPDRKSVV